MIQIFETNGNLKETLEQLLPILLGNDADVVMVNINQFKNVSRDLEYSRRPFIFYGFNSELRLRMEGNQAAPYFYTKRSGYLKGPLNPEAIGSMYHKIVSGKKISNKAVFLDAKIASVKNLVKTLLNRSRFGDKNCESWLEIARRELGITGSVGEVLSKLECFNGRNLYSIKNLIGDKVLPGIFCDVEGALLVSKNGEINEWILKLLQKAEKDEPVTLWTEDVNLEKVQALLEKKGASGWPLVSKNSFRGCSVETIICSRSIEEFSAEYDINSARSFANV